MSTSIIVTAAVFDALRKADLLRILERDGTGYPIHGRELEQEDHRGHPLVLCELHDGEEIDFPNEEITQAELHSQWRP